MGFVHRRILKSVLSVVRHPKTTLLLVVIGLAVCGVLAATRLNISSDQNKLFSPKVWFFRDYLDMIRRFPENEALYIIVEPRDPASADMNRWMELSDQIVARLRGMPEFVDDVYCKVPLDAMGRQGILYERPDQLHDDVSGAVQLAQFWGEKPSGIIAVAGRTPMERFLSLVAASEPDDQTAGFVGHLCESWNRALDGDHTIDLTRLMAADPGRLGYFYVPNELDRSRFRILVRVYPNAQRNSLTGVTRTVNAIRDAAHDVAAAYPDFQIGVTGRPALEADEMATTDADTHHAEIWALIAVFIGLVVMLRSIWLAVAAELVLGVGIGWTFGWATVTIGELNLLSLVFLIALIGIGMDYLVQILTRYRTEARRYRRPDAIWMSVFRHVGPPINTACLGAAGAFLVSIFTDFRGAAELGVIAGGGLLLCLTAGYTALPALLTLFPVRFSLLPVAKRHAPEKPDGKRRLILPIIWLAALTSLSPFMSRTNFNPGLIDLQPPNLESVKLIHTLQTWEAVVLSKDPNQLRTVRDKVAGLPLVASTESILDAQDNAQWLATNQNQMPTIEWMPPTPILPADLPAIAAKARNLARAFHSVIGMRTSAALLQFATRIEKSSDPTPTAANLSAWQNAFVNDLKQLMSAFAPIQPDVQAIPPEVRGHLVDPEGVYALYIYPTQDLWNHANLVAFMEQVEQAVGTIPNAPEVTGIASDMYHTTASIRQAFYQSTIYALALIFVLVLLDFRKLGPTLAAMSVLGFGLPMLVAMMGILHADWNFANFFGLPILIGAGHEYGVFMVHRYLEAKHHARRVWRGWDVSDRALLLCAYITSTSFGFFWLLAHHQGLKSLGLVMALGTACIYLSTVMVLRPYLRWRLTKETSARG